MNPAASDTSSSRSFRLPVSVWLLALCGVLVLSFGAWTTQVLAIAAQARDDVLATFKEDNLISQQLELEATRAATEALRTELTALQTQIAQLREIAAERPALQARRVQLEQDIYEFVRQLPCLSPTPQMRTAQIYQITQELTKLNTEIAQEQGELLKYAKPRPSR